MTPEEYRKQGDHWLQIAAACAQRGDHDQARTAAALAAPYFTAYAATYGARVMGQIHAEQNQPDNGADKMLAWLRQVNDGVFADGRPLSPESAAAMHALEAAGLAVEGRPGYWSLTGRGREELDRAGDVAGDVNDAQILAFLGTVRDYPVRSGHGDRVFIDSGSVQNFTLTRVAKVAFQRDFVQLTRDDDGTRWELTGPGRAALDQGHL